MTAYARLPLFRNALASPQNVLGAANANVIATDNLFNLARRARAVINKHGLAFAQLAHGRLFFENLRPGRNSP